MENLAELIAHPNLLNKDTLYELRELVAKYPYYQTARLLFLKNLFLLHEPTFGEELRKAALLLPDRRVLFAMIESANYEIRQQVSTTANEPSDDKEQDRTISLIDNFLREAADELPDTPRRQLTAADATTDYAAFLLTMDDAEPTSASENDEHTQRSTNLINDFIESGGERIELQENPEFTPEIPTETDGADDSLEEGHLTMTLAKIYIKQQRYEKALEIMRKVNLNNPKKSSYFADQIRFLRKLIINKQHLNQSE